MRGRVLNAWSNFGDPRNKEQSRSQPFETGYQTKLRKFAPVLRADLHTVLTIRKVIWVYRLTQVVQLLYCLYTILSSVCCKITHSSKMVVLVYLSYKADQDPLCIIKKAFLEN